MTLSVALVSEKFNFRSLSIANVFLAVPLQVHFYYRSHRRLIRLKIYATNIPHINNIRVPCKVSSMAAGII